MERPETTSPVPSTSAENEPEENLADDDPVSKEEEEIFTVKCLDVISKIAGMLQTDTEGFVAALETFLKLFEGERNDERQLKYGLMEEIMSSILEADSDELSSANEYFERILTEKRSKTLSIKDVDLETSEKGILTQKRFKTVSIKDVNLETSEKGILTQEKLKTPLIRDVDIITLIKACNGQLDEVYLGRLRQPNGSWKRVAIKKAIKSDNGKFIEHEARIMSQLNHKNVVKFYGKHEVKPENVLEFMDLSDFVTAIPMVNFTTNNLLRLLDDVACGMEYLTEKQIVHRNLTCINIFLNKKKQCKIGNFTFAVHVGNSNGVYIDEDCSIRLMNQPSSDHIGLFLCGGCCCINYLDLAPETIDTYAFSTATDVWCMGFLCWEMFTVVDFSTDNIQQLKDLLTQKLKARKHFLCNRIQLPRPKKCPEVLYQYIMKHLLVRDPKERASFTGIRAKINEIASSMSV